MIPVKLQIKNFVSYGQESQIIDFTPYNLICLSGKNGHGKSALLDALTWAIWGQARKISSTPKADEGLVRLGQTHMMVTLDFISNNTCYRVRREYSIYGRKSQTLLDFGIIDSNTSELRPLTDKTIKATQEKIETVIGLDYGTFINSAFLRQGQSNEFSKKSAKERKEILSSILGLNHYESLRKLASEKARTAAQERDFTQKLCINLEKNLEQEPTIKASQTDAETKLIELTQKEQTYKVQAQQLQKKIDELANHKVSLKHQQQSIDQIKQEITTQLKELQDTAHKWRTVFRQQRQTHQFAEIDKTYKATQEKLAQVRSQGQKYLEYKEQYYQLKEQQRKIAETLRATYQKELAAIEHQAATEQAALVYFEQQYAEYTQQLELYTSEQSSLKQAYTYLADTQLTAAQETITHYQKALEKRQAYFYSYSTRVRTYQHEYAYLQEQYSNISTHQQQYCSWCEQQLTPAHRQKFLTYLEPKLVFLKKRMQRLHMVIAGLDNKIKQLQADIATQATILHEYNTAKSKQEEQAKQLKKLEQLIKETSGICSAKQRAIQTSKEKCHQLNIKRTSLKLESYYEQDSQYQEITKSVIKQEKALQQLTYNAADEQKLMQELAQAQKAFQEYNSMVKESALQEQRKQTVHRLVQKIKQLKTQLRTLHMNQAYLKQQCQAGFEVENKAHQLMQELERTQKEKEQLILLKGSLEQKLENLQNNRKELQKKQIYIQQLDNTHQEYTALTTAFSKDGIPALLIEDALPEIELEANGLLGRLTDNQAQLSLESLRDLRGGGTKETLEIKISDAMGIRPYELFSGGEAFRIDFALRIALSKLLAKRAGTTLQTLIIDEGFGSQDEEGLGHILDVIHKIQDDFAKIIIVSHLPSMKEQFPVNFLIHKTPQGSLIKVLQHG